MELNVRATCCTPSLNERRTSGKWQLACKLNKFFLHANNTAKCHNSKLSQQTACPTQQTVLAWRNHKALPHQSHGWWMLITGLYCAAAILFIESENWTVFESKRTTVLLRKMSDPLWPANLVFSVDLTPHLHTLRKSLPANSSWYPTCMSTWKPYALDATILSCCTLLHFYTQLPSWWMQKWRSLCI